MGIYKKTTLMLLSSTFITPTVTIPPLASDLLTDETDGFAFNARTYDTAGIYPLYVGGPVGGTVCVKDTGTPANDLDDVALDASNIIQEGTSPKMVHWGSSPYVRWSAHNLCIRSEEIDNAAWTKGGSSATADATTAPDGESTADRLTISATATYHYIESTFANTVANEAYTVSAYVKVSSGQQYCYLNGLGFAGTDWYSAVFDLSGVSVTQTGNGAAGTYISSSITAVGDGWYRLAVTGFHTGAVTILAVAFSDTGTPAQGNFGSYTYNGNGTDAIYVWGTEINRGVIPAHYLATTTAERIGIPQDYDSLDGFYGLRTEPASTNYHQYSTFQIMAYPLLPESGTFTVNGATAPDGSERAITLEETAVSAHFGYTHQAVGSTSGVDTTHSIYVRAGGGTTNYFVLAFGINNDWFAVVFDVLNGVVGEEVGGTNSGTVTYSDIEDIGGGWYRCKMAGNIAHTGSIYNKFFTAPSLTGNTWTGFGGGFVDNFTGTAGRIFQLWGGQVEEKAFPTSFIPTTVNVAVTRAVDAVNAPISSMPYSQGGAGTGIIDMELTVGTTNNPVLWCVGDETAGNHLNAYEFSGSHNFSLACEVGGASQANFGIENGAITDFTPFIGALAWNTNDFIGCKDGDGLGNFDNTGTTPSGVITFSLGYNPSDVTAIENMRTHTFELVPRRMTNTELQTKTA